MGWFKANPILFWRSSLIHWVGILSTTVIDVLDGILCHPWVWCLIVQIFQASDNSKLDSYTEKSRLRLGHLDDRLYIPLSINDMLYTLYFSSKTCGTRLILYEIRFCKIELEPSEFWSNYFSDIQFIKCDSINPTSKNEFCAVEIVYQSIKWTDHNHPFRDHPKVRETVQIWPHFC